MRTLIWLAFPMAVFIGAWVLTAETRRPLYSSVQFVAACAGLGLIVAVVILANGWAS